MGSIWKTHNRLGQSTPLRTQAYRVARVLDIGACDDGAGVGEEGGADAEVGVGA